MRHGRGWYVRVTMACGDSVDQHVNGLGLTDDVSEHTVRLDPLLDAGHRARSGMLSATDNAPDSSSVDRSWFCATAVDEAASRCEPAASDRGPGLGATGPLCGPAVARSRSTGVLPRNTEAIRSVTSAVNPPAAAGSGETTR